MALDAVEGSVLCYWYIFEKTYEKSPFFAAAATLKFTGTESMSMRFSESIISEADNLRLRFRTVIKKKNTEI